MTSTRAPGKGPGSCLHLWDLARCLLSLGSGGTPLFRLWPPDSSGTVGGSLVGLPALASDTKHLSLRSFPGKSPRACSPAGRPWPEGGRAPQRLPEGRGQARRAGPGGAGALWGCPVPGRSPPGGPPGPPAQVRRTSPEAPGTSGSVGGSASGSAGLRAEGRAASCRSLGLFL